MELDVGAARAGVVHVGGLSDELGQTQIAVDALLHGGAGRWGEGHIVAGDEQTLRGGCDSLAAFDSVSAEQKEGRDLSGS